MNRLFCFILFFFSSFLYAHQEDWGDHWNNTGVIVTQPDVFNQSGISVTDTLGRSSPQTLNEDCMLIKMCYPNGQCEWRKQCK